MGCKNICSHTEFKEAFAVRNKVGKLPESIKKLFGYCSECAIYLISKPVIFCKCCGTKIRTTLRDSRNKDCKYFRTKYQEWYLKNKERKIEYVKRYQTENKIKRQLWNKAYYEMNRDTIKSKVKARRERLKQNDV